MRLKFPKYKTVKYIAKKIWQRNIGGYSEKVFRISLMAVATGVASAIFTILFFEGFSAIFDYFFLNIYDYNENRQSLFDMHDDWLLLLLVPTIGGLFIGILNKFLLKGQSHGIMDLIHSVSMKQGKLSLKTGLSASLISMVSLGVGASSGKEGPAVYGASAISSYISQYFNLAPNVRQILVASAAAGAVASSFNAPIAGVFFALEVVVGQFSATIFAPVCLAAIAATTVSRLYFGNSPAFSLPDYDISSYFEMPAFIFLGIICAILAAIMIEAVKISQRQMANMNKKLSLPNYLNPMIGGALIGMIAMFFPEILGVGYGVADNALAGQYGLYLLFIMGAAKFIATIITLSCGFAGGIFSPSVLLGIMMGGVFGIIASAIFPDLSSGSNVYMIVGMSAFAGSMLGAPMSTALIVFEMTSNFNLAIAVLASTVVASQTLIRFSYPSYFGWQLRNKGLFIHKSGDRELSILHSKPITPIISPITPIHQNLLLGDICHEMDISGPDILCVIDGDEKFIGTISHIDLPHNISDNENIMAKNICHKWRRVLHEGDSLEKAMRLFEETAANEIPVVGKDKRLIGIIHAYDIIKEYHRTIRMLHL